jgi:hypothetical protein
VHSLVVDHSRYAYSELHPDEIAATVTGFVERGLAHFAEHGIEAKRLISDNAWTYTRNKALARLLACHRVRHLLIPYRRPQVNGKVERYQQTLKRQWGLGQAYRSSDHRAQATVTLAQLLQHAQTAQLARRPATNQPRPQRPKAGHLAAETHTLGQQIVVINTPAGRFVATGDCVYSYRNLTGLDGSGIYVPIGTAIGSQERVLQTYDRVLDLVAGDLNRAIPVHDGDPWRRFPSRRLPGTAHIAEIALAAGAARRI